MSDRTDEPGSIAGRLPEPVFRVARIAAPYVLMAGAWQVASLFFPHFLFPSLIDVFWRCIDILSSWAQFSEVLATVGRIMEGLCGAFVIGSILALMITRSVTVDRFITPILTFFQGIPALSWVVFAIIWLHGTEFRIFFIMVLTTLPAFTFQVVSALKALSRDLVEMVMSFRPSKPQIFRVMVVPGILPDILTAWKVNLGNASRVVVVAELVGATGGVGYELLQQQQVFDMAGALAWTLQLVFFVLIVQYVLTLIETFAFRYRATSERSL